MDQIYAIKTDTEENYEKRCSLKRDIDELIAVWESSITMCSSCSAVDRDLRFNPIAGSWYCLECYKMYRDNVYKTMEKKKRGEFIGSDYDEELARSFTE